MTMQHDEHIKEWRVWRTWRFWKTGLAIQRVELGDDGHLKYSYIDPADYYAAPPQS